MSFDPKKHLIKVQGNREYLPVAARLIWFREQHPDWGINTRAVAIDLEKQYAIFEATIINAEGKIIAMGTKMENVKGFGDYLEKAETGSIGRALAVCGYGTQFAPELDEAHRIVDTPRQVHGQQSARPGSSGPSYSASPYSAPRPPLASVPEFVTQSAAPSQQAPGATYDASEPDPFGDSMIPYAEPKADGIVCADCFGEITANQRNLAVRKWGRPLCPTCQRAEKAMAA